MLFRQGIRVRPRLLPVKTGGNDLTPIPVTVLGQ